MRIPVPLRRFPQWSRTRRFALVGLTAGLLVASAVLVRASVFAAAATHPVSQHCHVTDGVFTPCPDGSAEWSDVTPQSFSTSNAHIYADQADRVAERRLPNGAPVDTFMLMYDECGRTVPLTANEYFLINFDTVEAEDGQHRLNRYTIHVFTDGTIVFIENGAVQTDAQGASRVAAIEGQRGKVAFGRSPSCAFDHVTVEYEIELHAAGGDSYSEDPLFWGGTVPDPLPACPASGVRAAAAGQCAPEPTPQEKYRQEQKANLSRLSHRLNLTAGSAALLATMCLAAPDPTFTKVCSILGYGFSAEAWIAAALLDILAEDPPDPNFTEIPVPVVPCLADQPYGATDGLSARTAAAINAYLDNAEQEIGLLRASKIAVDRAGGAFAAGDVFWETRQVIAIRQFASQLSTLLAAEPALRAELVTSVQAQGLGLALTTPDVRAMQDGVRATGLPAELTGMLTQLGATADDQAGIRQLLLDTDPAEIVGPAGSHFPENIADPTLLTDTAALADALAVSGGTSIRPGFDAATLAGNDDGSSAAIPLGFTANFFGIDRTTAYVNNNGNITFDEPLSEFTPFGLTETDRAIIAPFFADVDTRSGQPVSYGTGTVDGRPAFGVTWPGVGCFDQNTSGLNFFQTVLVQRADRGPGNFDIEFNYDSIQWEAGNASGGDAACQGGSAARAGFSAGSREAGTFFELPGSGVPGAFLDSSPTALIRGSLNSTQRGRYVFPVTTSGVPVTTGDNDLDGVPDDIDNCPRTANPDQADANLTGIGDACETPQTAHATAAFLQANLDGSTSAEPTGLTVADEPSTITRLTRAVGFRLQAGLTTDARQLTSELTQGLVDVGLVPASQASTVVSQVLAVVIPADAAGPVVTIRFPQPTGRNGWFTTAPVAGTVTVDDTTTGGSAITAITCLGAVRGPITGLGTVRATASLTVTGDGIHTTTCTGTDRAGNTGAGPGSTASATVKIDRTAPRLSCRPLPSVLRPANHRLVPVWVWVIVTDRTSHPAGFTLTAVRSNEPDRGLGGGDKPTDIQFWRPGQPDTVGLLRAERDPHGHGRIYTLTYQAADRAGNTASCTATVTVPK